ncbi:MULTISPECIES: hypothetical protein [Cyanophyceae]|uniref:hypothetical protein n=1 Tax=Cyanophyceae TaxID=3028117 RepID=UPI00168810BA|nr:hypothetical protein [Trichocoleus sp. FACHB-40]MBD2005626.1 hypothetical protein [Trichocoleus sp. FACHB-40]
MTDFVARFYGFTTATSYAVPAHINAALIATTNPAEIEQIISDYEAELAQLHNPANEFLVCDTAAELMADVLRSKGIPYKIICGKNDEGDSHSYIEVRGVFYDPTHQGFGEAIANALN